MPFRAYISELDRAVAELRPDRPQAGVADDEIEASLGALWGYPR